MHAQCVADGLHCVEGPARLPDGGNCFLEQFPSWIPQCARMWGTFWYASTVRSPNGGVFCSSGELHVCQNGSDFAAPVRNDDARAVR